MLSKGIGWNSHIDASPQSAQGIYDLLLQSPDCPEAHYQSQQFLDEQLERARDVAHDLPAEPLTLEYWLEQKMLSVGKRYAAYLEQRKQGVGRQYFLTKSHALSFLQKIAPTKLVDGAWLYGTLKYWQDMRFHDLVRTYLEELGDGQPGQNHVLLYQRLLADNECQPLPPLSDEHYLRGAIQLAFGYNAERFLPELIGYNLGYEQLPLHLLITAFELAELGIDPYYFTLHITVDNASTGHARKAALAVKACMPVTGGGDEFWRRVINGYQLNDIGIGATEIINGLDLDRELILMLERERSFGQHVHSDFCSIGGMTVNEWLSTPGKIQKFLETLQTRRWIIHSEAPEQSRFWRLIDGPGARMAGVFSGYEKQLIHDWIAGSQEVQKKLPGKRQTFRRYPRSVAERGGDTQALDALSDSDTDVGNMQRELQLLSAGQRMPRLVHFMNPAQHATPVGLFATREFVAAMSSWRC